jgi:hypothetical protein
VVDVSLQPATSGRHTEAKRRLSDEAPRCVRMSDDADDRTLGAAGGRHPARSVARFQASIRAMSGPSVRDGADLPLREHGFGMFRQRARPWFHV